MECKVTNLVYWNENIQIEEISSDNKCLKSKDFIPQNTTLIVEQVFCDNSKNKSAKYILDAIRFSQELYDSLYPRTKKWNLEDMLYSLESNNLILDKIKYNAFMKNNNVYIGEFVTKSNHNQNHNAKAFLFELQDEKTPYPLSYIVIVSTKDIKEYEEILIKYNDKVIFSQSESLIESFTLTKKESLILDETLFDLNLELKQEILNKIKIYQSSDTFLYCRTNQIGIYYGAFCIGEKIFFNEKFEKYLKEKNIENTLENRRLWFENIYQNI
jgi:hypothetical protein